MVDIKNHKNFTPEAAMLANQKSELSKWTIDYLESTGGNQELADIYKREDLLWSINKHPLKELIRVVGQDEGVAYYEDLEVWERRVKELVEKISQGEKLPPLIISNDSGKLGIADGNHRHEALLRCGIKEYYCIFTLVKK